MENLLRSAYASHSASHQSTRTGFNGSCWPVSQDFLMVFAKKIHTFFDSFSASTTDARRRRRRWHGTRPIGSRNDLDTVGATQEAGAATTRSPLGCATNLQRAAATSRGTGRDAEFTLGPLVLPCQYCHASACRCRCTANACRYETVRSGRGQRPGRLARDGRRDRRTGLPLPSGVWTIDLIAIPWHLLWEILLFLLIDFGATLRSGWGVSSEPSPFPCSATGIHRQCRLLVALHAECRPCLPFQGRALTVRPARWPLAMADDFAYHIHIPW